MKQFFSPSRFLILAVSLFVIFYAFLHFPQKSLKVIRLHHDQVEIQQFSNAIFKNIAEAGYGYKVELVESTVKEFREHIVRGDIHVMLELWKENNLAWVEDMIERGSIEDLGVIYNGGQQYWIVSGWYARKHNIRTVFDMADHWRDFVDPEDPSKGIFLNCIVGWPCREINNLKLNIYALDRYYNAISHASPQSLKSIYENSQINRLPLFGYYWEPNSIMIYQDWHILEEPSYSKDVWKDLIKWLSDPQAKLPEKACAYNDSGVHKVVYAGLKHKASDLYEMLSKMKIDYKIFNSVLFTSDRSKNDNTDFNALAQIFMCNYREVWSRWVPEDVQQKLDTAIIDENCRNSGQE